ncbi:MAG: hypothetical protein JST19_13150 [Bacteroidetes bacterium]|nr:hypothetical protein [Bacteroidota bacterium]
MKLRRMPVQIRMIVIILLGVLISCSGHENVGPIQPETDAQVLVQSGEWFTRGGTLTKDDGTMLVLAASNPFLKTILLYNVTFYANGTATDTNDPNGLTQNGLTWQLSGTHLLVHVNDNNTDKVDGMITFLSQNKMVLKVTDFYVYNGVTYTGLIQTFGH